MKELLLLLFPLLLFANLFNSQDFEVNNYGEFVLAQDKKSFYSLEPFSLYQIKQIDINTTKVIAKYRRYKDIDLESKDEKLVKKLFKKLYDYNFVYCVDRQNHLVYYANDKNKIVAYDYKAKKDIFVSKTLVEVKKYSKIKVIKLMKDKKRLIVGLDKSLAVFDTKTKYLQYFGDVSISVSSLDIFPNFKYIAVSGLSGDMKIYDYDTLEFLKKLQVFSVGFKESFHTDIKTIKFIDDDKFLYASSLEGVQLASVSSGKVIRKYKEHKLSPMIGIRKNRAYFITSEAKVYQYNLKKGKFIEVYALPLQNVKRVVSNGKTMLISQRDGKFIWYDLKLNRYKDYHTLFRDHYTASYDFHPSKLQFARVSSNHAMQIFDINSGKEIVRIENKIFDIAEIFSFLDDDVMIYSSNYCGYDKKEPFVLINTKRKKLHFYKGHLDTIVSYQLSNDKHYLITASSDRTIKLWKIDLKKFKIKELDTLHTGNIPYSTSLSDNEKSLAVSSEKGDLYIYGVDFKKQRFTKLKKVLEGKRPFKTSQRKRSENEQFNTGFNTLNTMYYNLRFYDNDTKLIAENHQRNFIVYDLKSSKKLYKLLFFNQRDWVKLYPDGSYESSKNGYKYIDKKFYNIFVEDKKVLQDSTSKDRKDEMQEIISKKIKVRESKSKKSNFALNFMIIIGGFLILSKLLDLYYERIKKRNGWGLDSKQHQSSNK